MERVPVHVSEVQDMQAIAAVLSPNQTLAPCRSVEEFGQAIERDDVRCGILDLNSCACRPGRGSFLVQRLANRSVALRIMLQVRDLTPPRMRLIREFADGGADFRLSVMGVDYFSNDIKRILAKGPWRTAQAPILRAVGGLVPTLKEHIAIPALLLGHVRWSVPDFATYIHMSERSLERHFNEKAGAKVRNLLDQVTVTHIMYHADELGLPLDVIATEFDFPSTYELKVFLKRKAVSTLKATLRTSLARPVWDGAYEHAVGRLGQILEMRGSCQ